MLIFNNKFSKTHKTIISLGIRNLQESFQSKRLS